MFRGDYELMANVDKTENTRRGHKDLNFNQDDRRNSRKFLLLLGVHEDINKHIQVAYVSVTSNCPARYVGCKSV